MKRNGSHFDQCTGIGVPDSHVKQILKRLDIGGGQNLSQARRFHRIHQCFSISKLDEVEVPLLDVSKFLDQIEEKQPGLYKHLYDCLCGRAGLNCTKGFLYIDEVTPGNVIAPDNKRKSYIVYYTWLELAKLRLDLSWIPVTVLRHDDVSKITGGLPRFMTYVISFLKERVLDGCRVGLGFLRTTELFLVADEGALKLCTDIKGASGLRPCLKCDVVSRARDGLPGFASVCDSDYTKFELSTEKYVLEIMQFLEDLSRGPASRLKEYQTITGFNHNPHVWFLQEDLRRLLPWENITYDSMHCYFSNGICCQEIGNFYTACLASRRVSRQHILDFKDIGWLSCFGSSDCAFVRNLLNEKLLKVDSDYRGDAAQTIGLFSLLAHFAETVVPADVLQAEVKRYLALLDVVNVILQSKIDVSCAQGLSALQSKHVELFTAAYPDCCRPKHHFPFHMERQIEHTQCHIDCFPMERKNKYFKRLAPNIQRLTGFSTSSLLRMVEWDLDRWGELDWTDKLVQPKSMRKPLDMDGITCIRGTAIKSLDRTFEIGQFLWLDDTVAYRISSCIQESLGVSTVCFRGLSQLCIKKIR